MTAARAVDYRTDVSPYARCVGEIVQLARRLPDGLARLRAFSAAGGPFATEVERVEGGIVVIACVPSDRTVAFLEEMRAAASGLAA